jgi:hypothetical protein
MITRDNLSCVNNYPHYFIPFTDIVDFINDKAQRGYINWAGI